MNIVVKEINLILNFGRIIQLVVFGKFLLLPAHGYLSYVGRDPQCVMNYL